MPEPYRPVLIPAGLSHPRVREFLAAKRRPAGGGLPALVPLEGTWMLRQALAAGVTVRAVFACPPPLRGADSLALAAQAVALGAEGYQVSERVLSRLADRDGPDGVAALGQARRRALGDICVRPGTRVMIADGWDLPGNLGTLIRCADGAGASAVLVAGQRFALNHPLVLKASMGTALAMPVIAVARPAAQQWLRENGFRTIAADPGRPRFLPRRRLPRPAGHRHRKRTARPGSGMAHHRRQHRRHPDARHQRLPQRLRRRSPPPLRGPRPAQPSALTHRPGSLTTHAHSIATCNCICTGAGRPSSTADCPGA
jgi:RNA methyltransferase, TrmH family